MDAAKTVTATFTQNEYSLTNISIRGAVAKNPDKATYHYGDVVQLTAAADAGWSFANWTGDLTGSVNPGSVTIQGNTTVTATFTQNEYMLTVNKIGNGTVTRNYDGPYHLGDVVQLTATADTGWTFSGWSGACTGADPCSATMDSSKTLTATFIQNEYGLVVNTSGSGSVTKSPDQATYHYGDVVQLTATPATGWEFVAWSGKTSGTSAETSITIQEDATVTATFAFIDGGPIGQYAYTLHLPIIAR